MPTSWYANWLGLYVYSITCISLADRIIWIVFIESDYRRQRDGLLANKSAFQCLSFKLPFF